MERHDLQALLPNLPELHITPSTTLEQAMAAHRMFGMFNHCQLGVIRYSGMVPWECHPNGDELLYVLDGTIVLTDGEPLQASLSMGSLFFVPKELWHRPIPESIATLLFATPTDSNAHSLAADPRLKSG